MDFKRLESSSNANTDITWWRKMWSLPLPSKVRLFVWRAFHEIIPTMASLGYRGIDWDVVCPRCKDKMESISHAILDCPTSNFIGGFCVGVLVNLEIVALHQVPVQSQVIGLDVWLPPQSGYLKLNVDASISPESDHIGIGAVICDEKGRILGAMEKSVEGTFSPFLAECIALREGPILENVKQLLAQLWNLGVYHIRRSANHVAHLLARFGFNSNCTNVWICDTPIIVSNAVSFDVIA
ncbi:hypothetical protein TIFTF001_005489 [Ficus carica]|uniref:Reverse transcriptase zinc-binding domain-containing protein n=1 Tax=Ficus carica TaxID=3494 RepID=A0AA88CUV0_FICCA|nr:hypothetical protein TIFTF001_005489 [Ficus carica]